MRHVSCRLFALYAAALVAATSPGFAQRGAPTPTASNETIAVPPESTSATDHELTLDGKPLRYAATAGNLLIDDEEEKPYGSIFHVAYTFAGVTDPRTRAVTFLYNGGPGSASL
jgi:carboxypeptidase C (cathepsin A)